MNPSREMRLILMPLLLAFLLLTARSAMAGSAKKAENPMPFATGVDLSMLGYLQQHGVQYKEGGNAKDPLAIFKSHGVNWVRLRLFLHPDGTGGQVNDLPYTLALAKQIKAHRLHFLLDFHYSDDWADPGKQTLPAAWKDLTAETLPAVLQSYTADTLRQFKTNKCEPDMIQVGNEITGGMDWPIGANSSQAGWDTFTNLLKAGIAGTRDGGYQGPIMIHVDQGGKRSVCEWFFDHLQQHQVPFDVIGLSYYPFWHGALTDLSDNLAGLAGRYGKPIIVVETAHYWRGDARATAPYPNTPEGQRDFLTDLIKTVHATPNDLGDGVFYWAPEWIQGQRWQGPDWSPDCESRALFDTDGNALPALNAFKEAGKQK